MPRTLSALALGLVPLWAFAAQTASAPAFDANPTQHGAAVSAHPTSMREAILSGALTSAELRTLAGERAALKARHDALRDRGKLDDAAQQRLQAERLAYADRVRALAENDVKGPPRKTLPEGWRQHGTLESLTGTARP
ncbi:hypothetical protein [Crenobacter cavernae]|uniref:Uncharacterized protein n=1 Tax=Crenobacter cavernae TaxID=2290923 RepID=A0ABY0FFS8_9NEIS|nr:hypothetical protein [Crenobacter cavernae]RXZ43817.1 hypothetical protein EBB06_08040 [Crenobacter cavernae]